MLVYAESFADLDGLPRGLSEPTWFGFTCRTVWSPPDAMDREGEEGRLVLLPTVGKFLRNKVLR